MAEKINIEGREIAVYSHNDLDYISLNDIAGRSAEGTIIISNWFRTTATHDFLVEWESIYNPVFNLVEGHKVKNDSGRITFTMGIKKWVEETNAIGLISKSGRYGGTFAHRDIAFEFGTRISPRFKILLIKEFQRLKSEEFNRHKLEWNETRFLSKINAGILSESIKENLVNRDTNKSRVLERSYIL